MDTNETRQDPVEMLLKYMEYGKNSATEQIYEEQCMFLNPLTLKVLNFW